MPQSDIDRSPEVTAVNKTGQDHLGYSYRLLALDVMRAREENTAGRVERESRVGRLLCVGRSGEDCAGCWRDNEAKLKKVREQVLQVVRRLRGRREGKALRREPVWCVEQREGQRGSRGEQEAGGDRRAW